MEIEKKEANWFMDKRLSIGVILAIIIQSGTFFWYGAQKDALLTQYVKNTDKLMEWREKQDDDRNKNQTQLALLSERMTSVTELLRKIDDRTEKLSNNKAH